LQSIVGEVVSVNTGNGKDEKNGQDGEKQDENGIYERLPFGLVGSNNRHDEYLL
jgi:hypothetical protein